MKAREEAMREEVDGKMSFAGIAVRSSLSEFVEQECGELVIGNHKANIKIMRH